MACVGAVAHHENHAFKTDRRVETEPELPSVAAVLRAAEDPNAGITVESASWRVLGAPWSPGITVVASGMRYESAINTSIPGGACWHSSKAEASLRRQDVERTNRLGRSQGDDHQGCR